jgi:hypothetical protein
MLKTGPATTRNIAVERECGSARGITPARTSSGTNSPMPSTGSRRTLRGMQSAQPDKESPIRESPIRAEIMGGVGWRELPTWPPRTDVQRWHLQPDAALSTVEPGNPTPTATPTIPPTIPPIPPPLSAAPARSAPARRTTTVNITDGILRLTDATEDPAAHHRRALADRPPLRRRPPDQAPGLKRLPSPLRPQPRLTRTPGHRDHPQPARQSVHHGPARPSAICCQSAAENQKRAIQIRPIERTLAPPNSPT